jgi:hypothetical protein
MYPSLTVVDARREGFTTARLWNMLSLSQINESMNSDLTPEERNMLNFSGLWSNNPLIDKLQYYIMDFGGASFNSSETSIHLMIENTGPIPFDWSLSFLSQLEVTNGWNTVNILCRLEKRNGWIWEREMKISHAKTLLLIIKSSLFLH